MPVSCWPALRRAGWNCSRSLGLEVDVLPSGYHEPEIPGLLPRELAEHPCAPRSWRARLLFSGMRYEVPVLAADTVVDRDGAALGKPRDAAEAARMLERLSGREHLVHTAFALGIPGSTPHVECATTRVWFYRLEPGEIAEYVATGEPHG